MIPGPTLLERVPGWHRVAHREVRRWRASRTLHRLLSATIAAGAGLLLLALVSAT